MNCTSSSGLASQIPGPGESNTERLNCHDLVGQGHTAPVSIASTHRVLPALMDIRPSRACRLCVCVRARVCMCVCVRMCTQLLEAMSQGMNILYNKV